MTRPADRWSRPFSRRSAGYRGAELLSPSTFGPKRLLQTIARHAILEFTAWAVVVGAAMIVYVSRYDGQAAGVIQHFSIIATIWAGALGLRLIVSRALPCDLTARWFNSFVVISLLGAVVVFEAGVLVGLEFWGRIPTLSLIQTYSRSFDGFLSIIGLQPSVVWLAISIGVAASLMFFSRPASAVHWPGVLARNSSLGWVLFLTLATLFFASVRVYAFSAVPPLVTGEPLSLMLFATRYGNKSTNYVSNKLAESESRARVMYAPSTDFARRNVVLIVADALRADHVSVNGYDRRTTPFIDSLVAGGEAQSATGMVAVCAESECGLKAIAQSRYVHEFPPNPITLYEVLRLHGYSVRMILSGDHTNYYGLKETFGKVDQYVDGFTAKDYYANDDQLVLTHLDALPNWDGKTTFLQIHLMSTHGLGRRDAGSIRFHPASNYYGFEQSVIGRSRSMIERARNYYDNGVVQFDSILAMLFQKLKSKGYLDDAILIVTADHGEMLGEHGSISHGADVYHEVLNVPFIMAGFGGRPLSPLNLTGLISQVDIAPTILRELAIPVPSTWVGRPLQEPRDRGVIYFQQGRRVGFYTLRESAGEWKFWMDLSSQREFAFDLLHDPKEAANIVERVPAELAAAWRLQLLKQAPSAALSLNH